MELRLEVPDFRFEPICSKIPSQSGTEDHCVLHWHSVAQWFCVFALDVYLAEKIKHHFVRHHLILYINSMYCLKQKLCLLHIYTINRWSALHYSAKCFGFALSVRRTDLPHTLSYVSSINQAMCQRCKLGVSCGCRCEVK